MRTIILVSFCLFSFLAVAQPALECQLILNNTSNPDLNPSTEAKAKTYKLLNSNSVDLSFGLNTWSCDASAVIDSTTQDLVVDSVSLNYANDVITGKNVISAFRGNDFALCLCKTKN
jgi:hypothetical protein